MSSIPQIENPHLTRTYDPKKHVAGIRFEKLGKLYHFDYTDFPAISVGDFVLVDTVRGVELGEIVGFVEREDQLREYKPILRIATARDLLIEQQWQQKEVEILINCREAASRFLQYRNVKFVKADYTFDGKTCTILYQAENDEQPNMYSLRRKLEDTIDGKLNLQQIGPREVARILGGQGACGGPRCCSTFLTEFSPISVKMARVQGIPLNPTEITGMCGRLRCCLIYEYEQYVEARKKLPRIGRLIGTPMGEAKVIDVYPLQDGVAVMFDDQRHFVEREDIIPLKEFRALKEKAEAGCSKNEGGGCDCGSRRPKSGGKDLKTALDMAHSTTDTTVGGKASTADDDAEQNKSRSKRRGDKRRDDSTASDDNKSSSSKSSRRKKKRRRRRNRRNNKNNNNKGKQ